MDRQLSYYQIFIINLQRISLCTLYIVFIMTASDTKASTGDIQDKEIVFSKVLKAGRRIYYIDVKRSRKED